MLTAVLVFALTVVQDDPAVAYREGLYEEVDQGNVDKALALYAKVIKAEGADAVLKAKALFRQGQCHEKQNRRKEAEQAYRDVIERFPGADDAVRLARARLAVLNGKETGGLPLEAQIAQLILDLGSIMDPTREAAIRRLTLLGGVAVPDLRRALQHKDAALSVGAARVLVEQEQYEGCYDVFVRAAERGAMGSRDYPSLVRLLNTRDEDRRRFSKDAARLEPWCLESVVPGLGADKRSAELQTVLADRVVAEEEAAPLITAWIGGADVKQIVALVERLGAPEKRQLRKLYLLLCELHVWVQEGRVEPSLSAALRKAAEGSDVPGRLRESVDRSYRSSERPFMNAETQFMSRSALYLKLAVWLPSYMTSPDAFALLSSWLKSPDAEVRRELQRVLVKRLDGRVPFPRVAGAVDFMFEVVGSADFADDVRNGFLEELAHESATAAQRAKLTTYFQSYLVRFDDSTASSEIVASAIRHLSEVLPPEAQERDALYDRAFRVRFALDAQKDPRYVAAAARALRSEEKGVRDLGVRVLSEAAVEERLGAPAWLKDAAHRDTTESIVETFAVTLREVGADRREKALSAAKPLFAGGPHLVRMELFRVFSGSKEAVLRDIMKEALTDPDAEIRRSAIRHWAELKDETAVPLLVQALKDGDDQNRLAAVAGLAEIPSLDAVPALIEMLRAPGSDIRAAARAALEKIRKHVDEQDEWRKWYEEVKKRGEKK